MRRQMREEAGREFLLEKAEITDASEKPKKEKKEKKKEEQDKVEST